MLIHHNLKNTAKTARAVESGRMRSPGNNGPSRMEAKTKKGGKQVSPAGTASLGRQSQKDLCQSARPPHHPCTPSPEASLLLHCSHLSERAQTPISIQQELVDHEQTGHDSTIIGFCHWNPEI